MGSDNMAASAPEEGRKCWLKVTFDSKSRMVEWNTNWTTFKEMETKVRRMYGMSDKTKLTYTYQETTTHSDIVMSSDEELNTALSLMTGPILLVDVYLERKRQKSPICRLMRAAKAQQPYVTELMTNLQATVLAHMPALSTVTERMRGCGQRAAACASARFRCGRRNNAEGSAPCTRSRKVLIALCVLLAAVAFAHLKCSHRRAEWMSVHPHPSVHNTPQGFFPFYSNQKPQPNSHITILAATYGGVDVTRKLQEYYNNNGFVKASNNIYGDPAPHVKKHLHVVFQSIGSSGIAEVFSQSFVESGQAYTFSMSRDSCAFPEEAIVDGRSVKVLGALFDDVSATCAARRFAATGRFTATNTHKDNVVHRNHFGTHSGNGIFTMAYLKDNTLQLTTSREGNTISF